MAKFPANRKVQIHDEGSAICDGSVDYEEIVSVHDPKLRNGHNGDTFPVVDYAGNIDPKSPLRRGCATVLTQLKHSKHAHWDVGGIIIDYDVPGEYNKAEDGIPSVPILPVVQPPQIQLGKDEEEKKEVETPELGTAASAIAAVRGALSRLIGTATTTTTATTGTAAIKGTNRRSASSLGVLLALDLTFLRPKFIVCRLHKSVLPFIEDKASTTTTANASNSSSSSSSSSGSQLRHRPDTNGYTTAHKIRDEVRRYDDAALSSTPGDTNGLYTGDDAYRGSSAHQAQRFLTRHGYVTHFADGGDVCGEGYVCVWGTLVSHLELYGF